MRKEELKISSMNKVCLYHDVAFEPSRRDTTWRGLASVYITWQSAWPLWCGATRVLLFYLRPVWCKPSVGLCLVSFMKCIPSHRIYIPHIHTHMRMCIIDSRTEYGSGTKLMFVLSNRRSTIHTINKGSLVYSPCTGGMRECDRTRWCFVFVVCR